MKETVVKVNMDKADEIFLKERNKFLLNQLLSDVKFLRSLDDDDDRPPDLAIFHKKATKMYTRKFGIDFWEGGEG